MKLFIFSVLLVGMAIKTIPLSAQNTPIDQKWGVEFNLLYPIYPGNVYQLKVGRELWKKNNLKGELLVGYQFRPEEFRDTEGKFSENAAVLSYRQYLWRGLNVEWYNVIGQGALKDHVTTGKDYNSFDVLSGLLVGYKVDIGKKKRFYGLLQIGITGVISKSDEWPIYEDETLQKEVGETAFLNGGLQIGYRF